MLVLSRRVGQALRFDGLDILVKVLGKSGNTVRLGVVAPASVPVARDEIPQTETIASATLVERQALAETGSPETPGKLERLDEEDRALQLARHDAKNSLSQITLAATLAKQLINLGRLEEAIETLDLIQSPADSVRAALDRPKPSSPERLLLVEDDANQRGMLQRLLETEGYTVVAVADGEEAWAALKKQTFSAVLLDMLLPKCDGATLLRRLRSDDTLRDLTVFAVSGRSPTEYGVTIGHDGADRWVEKPYNPRHLTQLLERDLVSA